MEGAFVATFFFFPQEPCGFLARSSDPSCGSRLTEQLCNHRLPVGLQTRVATSANICQFPGRLNIHSSCPSDVPPGDLPTSDLWSHKSMPALAGRSSVRSCQRLETAQALSHRQAEERTVSTCNGDAAQPRGAASRSPHDSVDGSRGHAAE